MIHKKTDKNMKNRLNITEVDHSGQRDYSQEMRGSRGIPRRHEVEALMERRWLDDPEQFNPERDIVQRHRVARTIDAIKSKISLSDKRGVDLGCGSGVLTRLLRNEGIQMDALDAAQNALNRLQAHDMQNIRSIKDCLPLTRLDDNRYDLVVCTEVIGFLQANEYRLFFAELARLVKRDGLVACSSSIDLNSENALEHFAAYAETEFDIEQWVLRYDLLWIRSCAFFEAPAKYIKASQDVWERRNELEKRAGLSRVWFKMNSTRLFSPFWHLINWVVSPIASKIRQSAWLMDKLGKITKFFWDESGVSHALFLGKKRPLAFPLPQNEIPLEMKHKRQVWE